ncbi:right-handed parallel beta-helix repeat-containing protein [Sphingosinicella sp.]|uniref:right-handed parallel beta-helix repeat-containing protein n=1 Tax=Sphingosinicella sp. TaxID=1917971 RepID=UPI004037A1C1
MIRRIALALGLTLALTGTVTGQPAPSAPFTVTETGAGYSSLAEAVAAIGDGQGTIRIAPGRYRQCAVQEAGQITFTAATPGTVTFDGVMCEEKAALVLRGRSARVEGLIFTNMRVPDGNGAGIRIEQGDLAVSETMFVDGQCGILSANDPNSRITIDRSTFSGLGRHPDGNGAHALYIGDYGSLSVTNSRFERGTGGHYLKSRAARIEVLDSSFDDSQGRETNYHIDLPNGASGRIAGNTFVQGTGKENYSTLIAVSAEEQEHSVANLVIENNTASLVPDFRWTTAFVGNWSGETARLGANRLAQGIRPHETH